MYQSVRPVLNESEVLDTCFDIMRFLRDFQHMHHDAQTAATVRATCVEMLPAYPAEDFVVVTLRTLTQLAAHALVDIPEQVSGIRQ